MTRGDPERIYQAQRAGISARLTQQEHVNEPEAERLIAAWEDHAVAEGLSRATALFWDNAWDWIADQREPKRDMGAEADDGQVYGG